MTVFSFVIIASSLAQNNNLLGVTRHTNKANYIVILGVKK